MKMMLRSSLLALLSAALAACGTLPPEVRHFPAAAVKTNNPKYRLVIENPNGFVTAFKVADEPSVILGPHSIHEVFAATNDQGIVSWKATGVTRWYRYYYGKEEIASADSEAFTIVRLRTPLLTEAIPQ